MESLLQSCQVVWPESFRGQVRLMPPRRMSRWRGWPHFSDLSHGKAHRQVSHTCLSEAELISQRWLSASSNQ